jgi:hypothetical protein
MNRILLFSLLGLIIGILWFRFGERFDQTKMVPKCWELLHYHFKEVLPLYIVHAKSIIAGLILILMAVYNYKYTNEVIAFIGAAIIGLHCYQYINEMKLIRTNALAL